MKTQKHYVFQHKEMQRQLLVDLHRRPDLRVVGFTTTVMYEGPQPYQPNASCVLIKFNCGRCGKLIRDNKKKENIIVDPRDQYCDV